MEKTYIYKTISGETVSIIGEPGRIKLASFIVRGLTTNIVEKGNTITIDTVFQSRVSLEKDVLY